MIKNLAKSFSASAKAKHKQFLTHELKYFYLGILFLGLNNGLMGSTFNNYLDDIFKITATQRGILEFPREFPGFALIFLTSLLTFLPLRTWAVIVGLLSAFGILGLGFFSPMNGLGASEILSGFHIPGIYLMTFWMMMWSTGDHLWMPVEAKIGLDLASKDGKNSGAKLGQITGIRNLAQVIGTALVWLIMDKLNFTYKHIYLVAFICALFAAYLFKNMSLNLISQKEEKRFVFKKKYTIFYLLNIFFGARKQIFLTFAPWVLIKYYHATPSTFAALLLIGSVLSYYFRIELGKLVDNWGERNVFLLDAVILIFISLSFILSKNVYVLYIAFLVDYLMFAMRIARTTYMQKIAEDKSDITPSLSLGITMDHLIAMAMPFLGGLLWDKFNYKAVFIASLVLALFSILTALQVRKSNSKKIALS